MSDKIVIDTNWNAREVRERFPTVDLIENDGIRSDTVETVSRMVPDYFFEVPASSSGKYHNPFCRGTHGLWIHVLMVATAYERLARSWYAQDRITSWEYDCGRAAVLCHDLLKYGHEYNEGDHSVDNHDILAAEWIRHNAEMPDEVPHAVARHNGIWYDGPAPETDLDDLVHAADMVASTGNVTVGVYEPHELIANRYPNLPHASL